VPLLHLDKHVVDLETGVVRGPDAGFTLSDRERDLLALLAETPGQVVSRTSLGGPGGSRSADMALSRLRRRLGTAGRRLVTVRGQGYRLDVDLPDEGLDLGWGRLDLERRQVCIGARRVALSEQQTQVLGLLARSPGQPVPRAQLAQALWGRTTELARLDLAVHRLRRRIERSPAQPRYLVSVRGRGLVLLDARLTSTRSSALPPLVPLLGRGAELRETLTLLERAQRRALLHGPPGIGKSALAGAVAAAWLRFGARRSHAFLDLHGVTEVHEAEGRLAAALGMDDVAKDDPVARSLSARGEVLLVVDGALPKRLGDRLLILIDAAPGLRVLVAAREAVPGFPLVALPGLSGPAARELLERAAERPLGADVDRISRRVEGNPLALELLGTGLRQASIADYERRLALPITPLRRAWRAVLQHLPDLEHRVALASSLFHRPFDAEDVAAVAHLDAQTVAALIGRLVARSILQREPTGRLVLPHAARELLAAEQRSSGDARPARARYVARCREVLGLLVVDIPRKGGPALSDLERRWPDLRRGIDVGDTGPSDDPAILARLAREAAERTPRARTARWATALSAAAARPDLTSGERALCLQAVHALRWSEMSRVERVQLLRRALSLSVEGGAEGTAASIAAELASVVAFSWGLAEARQILRTHALPEQAPVDERIRRSRHVGRLGVFAGRPSEGVARLREAVRLAEEEGMPLLEARCRMALGQALSVGAMGQEAEHHLRRAIALTHEHELPEQNVRATLRLAQHLLRLGLRADASQLLDVALDAAVRAGLQGLEEQCASTLGFLMIGADRLPQALTHLDRSIQLCEEHGGKRSLYIALANRGLARALSGQSAEALHDLHAALGSAGGSGGWYRALGLSYLAVAELLGGRARTGAVGAALDFVSQLEHPDGAALAEALRVVRDLAAGSLDATEASMWAANWRGGAEVEGVVLGVKRATLSPPIT
jgi:DNA-binding response OmpR family regulator/tetratricopeptide (TPR) repeat protein